MLLETHTAIGGYEILARLAAEGIGSQPPAAYRALEFLVEIGLAHRIERLNAYVACELAGQPHTPAFLICRQCRRVTETSSWPQRGMLGREAKRQSFTIEHAAIEAEGRCESCAADSIE